MEQKKFMDISRIRMGDELTEDNIGGFKPGDIIQISEKVDGSNASIRYDAESGQLVAFSRKRILDYENTLNGFWNYVQSLNSEEYMDVSNYCIFGEWLVAHTVKYRQECYRKWYVYDIYDIESEKYLPQSVVKHFCEEHNLTYVNVLYEGEFISWDHCRTFMDKSAYTDDGILPEGIVVKNQTNMNSVHSRVPFVLKIINDQFSETKKDNHIRKIEDPHKAQAKAHAQEIVDKIVTQNRVEKEIHKMIDEQILPAKITPQDMKTVSRILPKRIYDDCMKEEKEYVIEAGEFFGKLCGGQVMKFAKELILGQ